MRRFPRRKKSYSVLLVIFLVAVVFLLFQIISFSVLHEEGGRSVHQEALIAHKHLERDKDPGEDCIGNECSKPHIPQGRQLIVESNNKKLAQYELQAIVQREINKRPLPDDIKLPNVWVLLERDFQGSAIINSAADLLLGVNPIWREVYADRDGTYTCYQSKEVIPFDHVNDDFCDCEDGSDEPGTSACMDSRFYCQFQLSSSLSRWIPSSRVNDGICDCCDASDEWNAVDLPPHVQLNDGTVHFGLRQSPCSDHCEEFRSEEEAKQKLQQQGILLKQAYIKTAKEKIASSNEFYGPDDVFYKLSEQCFEHKLFKYTYKLCPFKKSEQVDGATRTVIGRTASWISKDVSHGFKLQMTGGDSRGCPDRESRQTVIAFECGLSDAILTLAEDERCVYLFRFSSPAAC